MNSKRILGFAELAVYVVIAYGAYYLFYRQAMGVFRSDMAMHLSNIDLFIHNGYHIPHPGFSVLVYSLARLTGLPYHQTGPMVTVGFLLATIYTVHWLLMSMSPVLNRFLLLIIAVSLLCVIAIYVPPFNPNFYVGQWSPNVWTGPNMLVVKPFVLLAFFYYLHLLLKPDLFQVRHYMIVGGALLLTTVIKPNFVITFLPAMALYLLLFRTRELQLYLKTFYMVFPTILMLAYQYMQTYYMDGANSHYYDKIIFSFFGVWKLHTPNVFISMLLVLAFPISVLVAGKGQALKNQYVRMAWILTLVAFLQCGLLAEEEKFDQATFCFGYDLALFVLYVFSVEECIRWFRKGMQGVGHIVIGAVGTIYLAHLVSGIIYLVALLNGAHPF